MIILKYIDPLILIIILTDFAKICDGSCQNVKRFFQISALQILNDLLKRAHLYNKKLKVVRKFHISSYNKLIFCTSNYEVYTTEYWTKSDGLIKLPFFLINLGLETEMKQHFHSVTWIPGIRMLASLYLASYSLLREYNSCCTITHVKISQNKILDYLVIQNNFCTLSVLQGSVFILIILTVLTFTSRCH